MRRLLFLASIVLAGLVAAPAQAGLCDPELGWAANEPAPAAEVLRLTNEHRATLGRASLVSTAALDRAAVWKAQHMARYGYLAHADRFPPIVRPMQDRLRDCGYPTYGGENIAYGFSSPASVFRAWLGSAGHRANIEHASWRAMGIGVVRSSSGVWFWAQTFGPVTGPSPAPQPVPPAPLPACNLPPAPGAGDGAVPRWFWGWAQWRLEGSRPSARPASAPRLIPVWAWRRLSEIVERRRGCPR